MKSIQTIVILVLLANINFSCKKDLFEEYDNVEYAFYQDDENNSLLYADVNGRFISFNKDDKGDLLDITYVDSLNNKMYISKGKNGLPTYVNVNSHSVLIDNYNSSKTKVDVAIIDETGEVFVYKDINITAKPDEVTDFSSEAASLLTYANNILYNTASFANSKNSNEKSTINVETLVPAILLGALFYGSYRIGEYLGTKLAERLITPVAKQTESEMNLTFNTAYENNLNNGNTAYKQNSITNSATLVNENRSNVERTIENSEEILKKTRNELNPILGNISIITPKGGEVWEIGNFVNVKWETGDLGGKVKIILSDRYNLSFTEITKSTNNDGEYAFTVQNISNSNAYCIIIMSLIYPDRYDYSEYFSLVGNTSNGTLPAGWELTQFEGNVSYSVENNIIKLNAHASGKHWIEIQSTQTYSPPVILQYEIATPGSNNWIRSGFTNGAPSISSGNENQDSGNAYFNGSSKDFNNAINADFHKVQIKWTSMKDAEFSDLTTGKTVEIKLTNSLENDDFHIYFRAGDIYSKNNEMWIKNINITN